MQGRPDIVVRSRDGGTIAVVEFKSWREMPESSAINRYEAIRSDGLIDGVPYYILVTPSRIYQWVQDPSAATVRPNGLKLDSAGLPPFMASRTGDPVDDHILLLATYQWLRQMPLRDPISGDPADEMFVASGLWNKLKEARFVLEPAA